MQADQTNVSVLMPMHNCADTLCDSVESVIRQTRGDWELLLVDDASQDGTLELARSLAARDSRIRVLPLAGNGGAAAARNHALAQARGRFIAFLDADDLWLPAKLERQLAFMARHDAALSFTGYSRVSPDGVLIARVPGLARVDHGALLKYNPMGCLTVIYDSKRCGKVAMPDLRRQHDYALWLQMTRRFGPALGLDEDLAIYRVRTASLSANKGAAALDVWRVLRRHERLSLWRAARAFGHYALHGLRHRLIQRPGPDAPVLLPLTAEHSALPR